jgi:hypothetical protein
MLLILRQVREHFSGPVNRSIARIGRVHETHKLACGGCYLARTKERALPRDACAFASCYSRAVHAFRRNGRLFQPRSCPRYHGLIYVALFSPLASLRRVMVYFPLADAGQVNTQTQPQQDFNCNWYDERTCCLQSTAESVTDYVTGNYTANCEPHSTDCLELLNMLQCALACSPERDLWDSVTGFKMCEDMADRLAKACNREQFPGTFFNLPGACQTFFFRDGRAFAQFLGWAYVPDDGSISSEVCWNSAGMLAWLAWVVQ